MGGTKCPMSLLTHEGSVSLRLVRQKTQANEWADPYRLALIQFIEKKKRSSGSSTDGVITWKSFVLVTLYRSPVWLTAKVWGGGSDSFGPNRITPKNQRFSHVAECSEQMFRGREKSPLCEWCGCYTEQRREVAGNKNRLKGCVGGRGAPPNPCVPADNYLVSSESSIYCAGALTGKQEMSSWLPIVISGLKACRYTKNSPLMCLTVIYTT